MKMIWYSLLFLTITSCQFFNTERISSETFYEEEMESIDWSEVDTYPVFKECETYTEREDQKTCFQNVIHKVITNKLEEEKIVVSSDINDEVILVLEVKNNGDMLLKELIIDSIASQRTPKLSEVFRASIQSLPNPAPAYKRGIPVATTIKLPFVLNSESL